jgi:quercetin dioxygenase-like cupin family protein
MLTGSGPAVQNTGSIRREGEMKLDDFKAQLAAEGFEEAVTVEREADGSLDSHAHPFEAKALILEGELSICTDDGERTYRSGDIFHLAANVFHTERYGPAGVKYLVGRKAPADQAPTRPAS